LVGPALAPLEAVMIAPVTLGGDWSNADNERAVLEILAEVERVYVTDPRRRVITGYSMGGAGTWIMLERHAGYFSAAIPISGFKPIAPDRCTIPLYALHSNADSIFDADELRGLIDAFQSAGCAARAEFIDHVDHFNIPAFAPLLERTVPWLREVWARAG
jgi:predicted peptidase